MKYRWLFFTLILALGAFLRLAGLGRESFWHDEAWSWWLASGTPSGLVFKLKDVDAHPPLFYLLLVPWVRFGDTEAWLRIVPAVLGIACLPLMERLGRRVAGPGAGLLAMLFLAICPIHVYFSQEVRSYSLLFLEALALANLVVDLRETGGPRWKWIAASVATASMMYTHYMGAFFLIAMAIVAVLTRDRRWLWVLGGSLVLFVPWFPVFVRHTLLIKGSFWIPFPTAPIVGRSLAELMISPAPAGGWTAYVWMGPIAALVLGAPWIAKDRKLALWFLPLVLPILGEYLVSYVRPLYYTRTFLYVLIPFWLLAAIAVTRLPKLLRPVAAFLVAGAMLPGLITVRCGLHKEDWRNCAGLAQQCWTPGEVAVIYPEYLNRNLLYAWRNGGPPLRSMPGGVSWTLGNEQDELDAFVGRLRSEGVRGVWLVRRPLDGPYAARLPLKLDELFPRRYRYAMRNTEVIYWAP